MARRSSPDRTPEPDRVPELTHYRDEGCQHFARCLECPFPDCIRRDRPANSARAVLNEERNATIRDLYARGEQLTVLATQFNLGTRQVYRTIGGVQAQRAAARHRPLAGG